MRRPGTTRSLLAASALCLLAIGGAIAPEAAEAQPKNVILMSWDGVRLDVLQELLEWQPAGSTPQDCPFQRHPVTQPVLVGNFYTCLPNLSLFQLVSSQAGLGRTHTRPQHTQMLSGYSTDIPDIFRNRKGTKLNRGYSIYEQIAASSLGNIPMGHQAGKKFVGRSVTAWAQKTDVLDIIETRGGPDGMTGINALARAVSVLDHLMSMNSTPFFMFAHVKTADLTAHKAGDWSTNYREGMILNDQRLGEFLVEMADRGLDESNTVLYITTDHGFNGRNHTDPGTDSNTDTWMASNADDLTANGSVHDIVPTIFAVLGATPDPALPAHVGTSRLQ